MGLGYIDVRITYGDETVTMSWDASEANAPIKLDGARTPYQTADAGHRTQEAVRLCAAIEWPEVGDWSEGTDAWDSLAYEATDEKAIECTIRERGNGLPGPRDIGAYVPGDDGELYRLVSVSGPIHTGRAGDDSYVHATVTRADWSDCNEGEELRAVAILARLTRIEA